MAEGLLKQILAENNINNVIVHSAGISASSGFGASLNAVRVMQEQGVDISRHRSMPITSSLIANADVILVMESYHKEYILNLFPEADGKVKLVKEFGVHTDNYMDIRDPIGGSIEAYQYCAQEIKECLLNFVEEYFDGNKVK